MTWFVRVAGFYNAGAIVVTGVLAAGDVPLALITIFGLPHVLGCGHGDLLRNRVQPIGAVA